MLKQIKYRGPSYCVKFLDENRLFCGTGSYISIFDIKTGESILQKYLITNSEFTSIKGIRLFQKRTVFVFGQKVVFKIRFTDDFADFYVEYSYFTKDWVLDLCVHGKYIIIGYANNFVEVFVENSKSKTLQKISTNWHERKCFLYSLSLKIIDGQVFVASAVTYYIDIWKFEPEKSQTCKSIDVLKGHNGLIYSIRWSEDGKSIATCSEDRFVKYWSNVIVGKIKVVDFVGHSARPWCVVILENYLVSSSQGGIRVWNKTNGSCIHVFEGHVGNIWKIDIINENIIASVANDSSIKLWYLSNILGQEKNYFLPYVKNGRFNTLFSNSQSIYATSTQNTLTWVNRSKKSMKNLKLPDTVLVEMEKSCFRCIAATDDDQFLILCGSKVPACFLFEKNVFGGLVFVRSFEIFRKESNKRIESVTVKGNDFLFFSRNGHVNYFVLNEIGKEILCQGKFEVNSRKIVLTTGTVMKGTNSFGFVVTGDKKGGIFVFSTTAGSEVVIHCKLHRNMITSITSKQDLCYSVSKDGFISICRLNFENQSLRVLYRIKTLAYVPLPYEICLFNDDIRVLGFFGNNLISMNFTKLYREICFQMKCRIFHIETAKEKTSFVFLEKDKITELNWNYPGKIQLTSSICSRQIYSVKFFRFKEKEYLVACSEDRTLVILTYPDMRNVFHIVKKNEFKCMDVLQYKGVIFCFLGGSKEELSIWKFSPENHSLEIDELFCKSMSLSKDINYRIISIAVQKINQDLLVFTGTSNTKINIYKLFEDDNGKFDVVNIKTITGIHHGIVNDLKVQIMKHGEIKLYSCNSDSTVIETMMKYNVDLGEMKIHYSKKRYSSKDGVISLSIFNRNKEIDFVCGCENQSIYIHSLNKEINDIHSSAVTGVFINENYVITASYDQRVSVFAILRDKHRCSFICGAMVNVSLIQGISICNVSPQGLSVIIFGSGIEILYFEIPQE